LILNNPSGSPASLVSRSTKDRRYSGYMYCDTGRAGFGGIVGAAPSLRFDYNGWLTGTAAQRSL
jgi:hypothetical protein